MALPCLVVWSFFINLVVPIMLPSCSTLVHPLSQGRISLAETRASIISPPRVARAARPDASAKPDGLDPRASRPSPLTCGPIGPTAEQPPVASRRHSASASNGELGHVSRPRETGEAVFVGILWALRCFEGISFKNDLDEMCVRVCSYRSEACLCFSVCRAVQLGWWVYQGSMKV